MKEIITQINKSLEIKNNLLEQITNEDELIKILSEYIQTLINKNFDYLLWLLYKIDVSEKKVKQAIQEAPTDKAHLVIAKMIIEREKEKIKTRENFSKPNSDNDWIF